MDMEIQKAIEIKIKTKWVKNNKIKRILVMLNAFYVLFEFSKKALNTETDK